MASKEELRRRASEVKQETVEGANTANRIGDLFYDIVNKLIEGIPYSKADVDQIVAELTEAFNNEIAEVTASIRQEEARLTELVATLNNQISNQVKAMFEDKTWLNEELEGTQVQSNYGDSNVDAFLQTIGIIKERDPEGKPTVWNWSAAGQTAEAAYTKVNAIEAIPGLPDNFNTYQSNIMSEVDVKDQSVKNEVSSTYAKIADTDGLKEIVEWMYAGFNSMASPTKSYADILASGYSTDENSINKAISNFHAEVIQDADGRYTSTADVSTMVNNAISGLALKSEVDQSTTDLYAKIGENTQAIAGVNAKVEHLEDGNYISENSLVAAVTRNVDGVEDVLVSAGMINTANLEDKAAETNIMVKNDVGTEAYITAKVVGSSSELRLGANQIYLDAEKTLANTIEATQGTIAGWEIDSTSLSKQVQTELAGYASISLNTGDLPSIITSKTRGLGRNYTSLTPDGFSTYGRNESTIVISNALNSDGSGLLASGNISWDAEGNISFSNNAAISVNAMTANTVTASSYSYKDIDGDTHEGWSGYLPLKLSDGTEIELIIDGGIITGVGGIE